VKGGTELYMNVSESDSGSESVSDSGMESESDSGSESESGSVKGRTE
jgi:hypothetical protein